MQVTNQSIEDKAMAGDILPLPLSEAERIEYQKAAERCGLSLTAWIRSRLHEMAKREAKET
jgi:hypothetical protein